MNSEYRESYNAGQELIPDFAYDALRNNDTSLSYDADDIIGKGALVPHAYPMLSLPTHYLNVDEITLEQIDALCGSHDTYIVSFKYDGVSISAPVNGLGYTGRLVSRGKRHSGFVLHPMFMQQMPKFLDRPDGLPITDSMNAEVRGEFVISKADFETINKTLTIAYANERSMVSAQLSANEPNPDIVKCIKFFAHGMWVTPLLDNSHIERLGEIYEYDNVVDFRYANRANLVQLVKQMYFAAMNSPYPCDGIVIQHSNTSDNDGHCNFDRIAIKQFDESLYSAETEVSGFSWTLKNNGSLYPNVQLKPVQINGSTVDNPAGYSLDYLNRMGLSVGAKVVVTLRGGVIPYITKVLAPGNGDLCFPPNIIEPEPGDMHLWSKDSEDAIQRLRFIRGCQMLDLKDCGTESFSKLYDAGYKTIFDLKFVSFAKLVSTGIFAKTATTENLADRIRERIDTFNYVWLILSLRIPGIGFKAANILGQKLSGYNLTNCGITEAMSNVLSDEVLIDKIKVTAKPVLIEHADLSEEFKAIQIAKNSTFGAFRKKAILSKKPSNGMKKAEFAAKYLSDYDITDDLAQADILVYPEGETSNKINWMLSHGKEARTYESFIN